MLNMFKVTNKDIRDVVLVHSLLTLNTTAKLFFRLSILNTEAISGQLFLSIPPGSTRKPEVNQKFSDVSRGVEQGIGLKWSNFLQGSYFQVLKNVCLKISLCFSMTKKINVNIIFNFDQVNLVTVSCIDLGKGFHGKENQSPVCLATCFPIC